MIRSVVASLAGLVLLVACATPREPAAPEECYALFERLDWLERFYPGYSEGFLADDVVQNPRIARQARAIQRGGCVTSVQDLGGMDALAAELQPFAPVEGGGPAASTALQVGIVDGLGAEIRTATFFGNLGYRYRGTGVEGLGRRIYVGPIRSQAAMDQAIEVARRAGFIAPYPARWVRF